jgi:hypothetical protein
MSRIERPSPSPSLLLIERCQQHGKHGAVLGSSGSRLHCDQAVQLQDAKGEQAVVDENGVRHQVLVVLARTELAKDVQLAEVQLEIQVTAARELLTGGWEPAIREIETMMGPMIEQPRQQSVDVLGCLLPDPERSDGPREYPLDLARRMARWPATNKVGGE